MKSARAAGCDQYLQPMQVRSKSIRKLSAAGAIMFVDPRPRAHMNRVPDQTTEITILPKPGLLILFPSYYEHAVIPFRGPGVPPASPSTPTREIILIPLRGSKEGAAGKS